MKNNIVLYGSAGYLDSMPRNGRWTEPADAEDVEAEAEKSPFCYG